MLDAVEDKITHKPQTLPLREPVLRGEREENFKCLLSAGKKAQEGFSNRRYDFWSEVLRMSFKEEREQ